jgi:hypothetical protein
LNGRHCSSGGWVFGIEYTTRVVRVPLHIIHIHILTYYIIIGMYTDQPANLRIYTYLYSESEKGRANRLVRLWARRLSVSFNAFLKHRTPTICPAQMKILLHNNVPLYGRKKMHYSHSGARDKLLRLSFLGSGFFFFLLLNSCRGTVNSSARRTQ